MEFADWHISFFFSSHLCVMVENSLLPVGGFLDFTNQFLIANGFGETFNYE